MQIFVTNKNDFDHWDRFDGVDYVFPAGDKQIIDSTAAAHMFGLGKADKTETLTRLGWVNDGNEGVKKLAKFVFTEARIVEVEEETEEGEEIDSIPEKPSGPVMTALKK